MSPTNAHRIKVMRIFVSWSGPASHEMAILLRKWLLRVLQYSDPFVSSKDINKGAQWLVTISEQLADTSEGIVCVTPSNVTAPWLNYEAGALAKTTGQTAVRTVLLGLKPSDLPSGVPLSNFMHTDAFSEDEMWSLIKSIHSRSGSAETGDFRWAFEQAWPKLLEDLRAINLNPRDALSDDRDEKSLLKDVVREVKELSITVAGLFESSSPVAIESAAEARRIIPAFDRSWMNSIAAGMDVRHSNFGLGTVIEVMGEGENKMAKVEFPASGLKNLKLSDAPLRVLK